MSPRRFSIVVNTDNRAESLALTLEGLTHLDHPDFEVVVVRGPTEDGTDEILARYAGALKVGRCPDRNISKSRNIGIALAAGEIVAFIDDDAYPDPAWLDCLDDAYDHPEVAGVGGPVWDWTGARLQVLYSWANRLGDVWVGVVPGLDPSFVTARPGATTFTYPIGTNTSFRRDRLMEFGGFDEEFEYGWDEVDLCHRLIDAGWVVRTVENGYVYHKALPSSIRGENRATHNMEVLLKNKAYYTFKHGWGIAPLAEIADSLSNYARHYRAEITENVRLGLLSTPDLEQYEEDVVAGFDRGRRAWLEGRDRRRSAAWFARREQSFLWFPTLRSREDKLHLCFFSVEYPPDPVNGIGRVIHALATGLGRRGHEVHVLTRGSELDRVDLEDGVWVHRVVPRHHALPEGILVPQGLWDYAASLRNEALRIHERRPLDLVQAPNWSTEGIAVLVDGRLRLVVGLYTPLATVADVDSPLAAGRAGGDPEVPSLIELERVTYRRAPSFLACGEAIVREIEDAYQVSLGDRVGYVAHGIEDRAGSVEPVHWDHRTEVLFVGRLEDRKGIDTLLAAIPGVVEARPEVGFTIVGDDTRPMTDGLTHRQRFERSADWPTVADHVRFLGRVADDDLYPLYAGCDIFVAPSRYESFGLIVLEAMMFAKPVVASAAGGLAEIVVDGETGVLVAPGDAAALRDALIALVSSPERSAELGFAGRRRFDDLYRQEVMVEAANQFYDDLLGRSTARVSARATALPAPPSAPSVTTAFEGPAVQEVRPPAPPAMTPTVAGGAPGLRGLPITLLERLRCPRCGSALSLVPGVLTVEGSIKTGRVRCHHEGRDVATIEHFKPDFLADPPPALSGPPVVITEVGERRVRPEDPLVERIGRWVSDGAGSLVSPGTVGDSLVLDAEWTDAIVRMRRQPTGGIVDVFVDGVPCATVDLFQAEGSENLAIRVASDQALARRRVEVRARGQADPQSLDKFVSIEEFVLYGPLGTDGFGAPGPINRGNPYSPYLDRWLDEIPEGEPVLEFGGGDRRLWRPGQINLEYLKFELADGYADIHAIPFADDTFAATWTQAVFEHLDDPFRAAAELVRVTRPGGLILTEVAFMQPLHAVPYHFFNMTTAGVRALFRECEVLECDWFGDLSTTIEWMVRSVNLPAKLAPAELEHLLSRFRSYDALVSHDELRPSAGAVYLVVRKPA